LDEIDRSSHGVSPVNATKVISSFFTHEAWYKSIKHIFVAEDRAKNARSWKKGRDYMGPINGYGRLKLPDLLWRPSESSCSQNSVFRARPDARKAYATEYWPYLYELYLRRNPQARKQLKDSPQRLCEKRANKSIPLMAYSHRCPKIRYAVNYVNKWSPQQTKRYNEYWPHYNLVAEGCIAAHRNTRTFLWWHIFLT